MPNQTSRCGQLIMQIIIRRFVFFTLLIALCVALACSQQPDSAATDTNTAAANSANATGASAVASPAPNVEVEPVMPEKVQVAFEKNCKTCHGPEGRGIPGAGKDLHKAARRTLPDWVKFMKDEKGTHAATKIPAMASLTDEDYEAIGGYLADLTQNNVPAK